MRSNEEEVMPVSSGTASVCEHILDCEVAQDRRVMRSRQALRASLIVLMEEKGFDNITVNDLCSHAGLNRGTFYNHFKTKEELLWLLEDEVIDGLAFFRDDMKKLTLPELAKYAVMKKPLPFLVSLFDYLREQGDFLHAVLGPGGDIRFSPRIRDVVCTTTIQCILHERYRHSTDPLVQYYVSFFASAYLGVIMRWIETGMKESSEEMAKIATRLFFIKPGESIKM